MMHYVYGCKVESLIWSLPVVRLDVLKVDFSDGEGQFDPLPTSRRTNPILF